MKKSLVLGLLLATSSVMAGTIKTSPGFGPFNVDTGGEFTIQVISGINVAFDDYAAETKGFWDDNPANKMDNTFQTFCVERGVRIGPNTVYGATLSQKVNPAGTDLNLGTAWLYQQFATGDLADYPYANYVTRATATAAGAVQNALWKLMGFDATMTPAATAFYDAAVAATLGLGGFDAANNGQIPVAVMSLWSGSERQNRQDVLVLIPAGVPDGGLTLSLLGMGLASLGIFSRRIRK